MSIHEIKEILAWCTCINYAILCIWFGAFVFAHDSLYRMHTIWFKLSRETFDMLHYGGMAVYKIAILMFNLVPLVALYFLA